MRRATHSTFTVVTISTPGARHDVALCALSLRPRSAAWCSPDRRRQPTRCVFYAIQAGGRRDCRLRRLRLRASSPTKSGVRASSRRSRQLPVGMTVEPARIAPWARRAPSTVLSVNRADESEPSAEILDFRTAWSAVSDAERLRVELIDCWNELRSHDMFTHRLTADGVRGQLWVEAAWQPEPLRRAERIVNEFVAKLRSALDGGIFATARTLCGISTGEFPTHRFPFAHSEEELLALVGQSHFRGLRPDQLDVVAKFQPYSVSSSELAILGEVRVAVSHLEAVLQGQRLEPGRALAVWAHSCNPQIRRRADHASVDCVPVGADRVLVDEIQIATFDLTGDFGVDAIAANPGIAFDFILNSPPIPRSPDDNFGRRSSILLASTKEFLRSLERSLGQRPPIDRSRQSISDSAPHDSPSEWGRLSLRGRRHRRIERRLRQSELGLAMYSGADGERIALVWDGHIARARVVAPPDAPRPRPVERHRRGESRSRRRGGLGSARLRDVLEGHSQGRRRYTRSGGRDRGRRASRIGDPSQEPGNRTPKFRAGAEVGREEDQRGCPPSPWHRSSTPSPASGIA